MADFQDEKAKKPKTLSPEELYEKLAAYCAKREHCTADVEQKLRAYQVERSLWAELIAKLRERSLLDDERFAKMYARSKHEYSRWGRYRIQQELRQRRIPSAFIEQALSELYEEYEEDGELIRLLEGKDRTIKASEEPRKRYDKLVRFAMYRGYAYESIKRAIAHIDKVHRAERDAY